MNQISDIFDNLDNWRHFPSYQLERRADIFFSIYLNALLSQRFGVDIEFLIPEFPIHKKSVTPQTSSNRTITVNYFAKMRDKNLIIFIELKTDVTSRQNNQDQYLQKAKEVGIVKILTDLQAVFTTTHSKNKYKHLLRQLNELKMIKLNVDHTFAVPQHNYEIQVIHIQPNNKDNQDNVITFHEVASTIEKWEDAVSIRFAHSLRKWADEKASAQVESSNQQTKLKTVVATRSRVINQGDIYWIQSTEPAGSELGYYPHPYVIIQQNLFNHSRINSVVVCALTSNIRRSNIPGNVLLKVDEANLAKQSVVEVSKVSTVDKAELGEYIGTLSEQRVKQILAGMRFLQSSYFAP